MATNNPAFSSEMFSRYDQVYGSAAVRSTTMTVQGTVGKTSLLLAILSGAAIWTWTAAASHELQPVVLPAALIGGLVLSLITIFKPSFAPWTAPVYAAFEGVFLGALSYMIEHMGIRGAYPGIALQAVSLTCGVLCVMLFLYASRIIKVTDRLRIAVTSAMGALCLVYFLSFMLSMFGVPVPYLRNATPLGIGIGLFVVGLAAFKLLLDFDFIEKMSAREMPKSMEWYAGFALVLTLVWLYLEILQLLRQFGDRRN